MSFGGFIQNIRGESIVNVAVRTERAALNALSKPPAASFAAASITPKVPDAPTPCKTPWPPCQPNSPIATSPRGKAMFTATACVICHKLGSEGSSGASGAGDIDGLKRQMEEMQKRLDKLSDKDKV